VRELTYMVATTLDGFIAAPEGGDPSGTIFEIEGDHMAYGIAEYPEMIPTPARNMLGIDDAPNKHFDTVLYGRGTWEVGADQGLTSPYAHLRQVLFSRTISASPDPAVELFSGDAVDRVRQLKEEDGQGIWLCGGAALASALQSEIDVLLLKMQPVVIGAGIPLFLAGVDLMRFDLADCRPFDSGVAFMTYRRRSHPSAPAAVDGP
jgi:dihydrofolate reductase